MRCPLVFDCRDEEEKDMNVPQHVAIILDGNGRWAKSKGMPRNYGHAQGSKNVERICEDAYKMGIKYLTVYAFSTENWAAQGRSGRADDAASQLYEDLPEHREKEPDEGAGHR